MAQPTLQISTPTPLLRLEPGSRGLKSREYVLTVISGPNAGKTHALLGPCVVGSHEDAGFQIDDATVSRFHVEIEPKVDGVTVRDLSSTNGTFLAGVKVHEVIIQQTSDLTVGKTVLRLGFIDRALDEPDELSHFGKALGASSSMKRLFGLLQRVAPSESTVLLLGETGTGKEVLAHSLHEASKRKGKPFVIVDCGAVSPNLIESELFGHVKGAYTGAVSDRLGAFLEADGGTIFLDEIGELPIDMQPKLLRVIESGSIKRVGEDKYRRINVRIVAATHRDLDGEVKLGRFREDLFYRLAVVVLTVPPLRDRPDDIPLLARHFVKQLGREDFNLPIHLLDGFREYRWPGNVRELRNIIERALAGADLAPPATAGSDSSSSESTPERHIHAELPFKMAKEKLIEDFTREYLTALLEKHQGNISQTARAAGIARNYVHRLVIKYGLKATDF